MTREGPHVLIWEFSVRAGCEEAFESAYGPDGDWARLFRRASGYLGTELLCSATDGERRYVTIDRWRSAQAFARFKDEYAADYAALDARCEPWTAAEAALGAWTGLAGAGSASE